MLRPFHFSCSTADCATSDTCKAADGQLFAFVSLANFDVSFADAFAWPPARAFSFGLRSKCAPGPKTFRSSAPQRRAATCPGAARRESRKRKQEDRKLATVANGPNAAFGRADNVQSGGFTSGLARK